MLGAFVWRGCQAIFAVRAVIMAYVSAAQRMGGDLIAGHIFPVISGKGGRDSLTLSAARTSTALQRHMLKVGLPSHFTMHYSRVGGSLCKSLTGTAEDEIFRHDLNQSGEFGE